MTFFLSILSSFYHLCPLQMNFIKLFTKDYFLLHDGEGTMQAALSTATIHPLLISFSFLTPRGHLPPPTNNSSLRWQECVGGCLAGLFLWKPKCLWGSQKQQECRCWSHPSKGSAYDPCRPACPALPCSWSIMTYPWFCSCPHFPHQSVSKSYWLYLQKISKIWHKNIGNFILFLFFHLEA